MSDVFRVLSLDGGGAKGFYTLGVLQEIEGLLKRKLGKSIHERFNLIYGTSTGAIIAALLALGKSVDEIHMLYEKHVPDVMRRKLPSERSAALARLAAEVFGDAMFADVHTNVGIVTTKWEIERPMIFKGNIEQAHGRKGTFVPGFGVKIGDAVQASCSAYPFFNRKLVLTAQGDRVELIDGGYCANNPTLYAIADALIPLGVPHDKLRVVSIGVGEYPEPPVRWWQKRWWMTRLPSVQLLQKTLEINTQSMDQLRAILFKHVETIRIHDAFTEPTMATDMFEHNMRKLNLLRQRGRESYAKNEKQVELFLL